MKCANCIAYNHEWCGWKHDSPDPDMERECNHYKAATNADKIRAMSDEELAGWIDEFWSAAWCPDDPPVDPETKQCLLHDGDCRLCILDWLRQEVKE